MCKYFALNLDLFEMDIENRHDLQKNSALEMRLIFRLVTIEMPRSVTIDL